MSDAPRHEDTHGSGHDRTARERDVLRELHELTGRPRAGDAPERVECEPGPSATGPDAADRSQRPKADNR